MYKSKNYFFRINSDPKIGLGHLARCLILAKYLKKNCYFIIDKSNENYFKNLKINLISIYKNEKYKDELSDAIKVEKIIKKFENVCLIADDYRIGIKWHKYFRKKNIKILVIDDLLNRRFETDIYLNFRLDSTKEFKEKLTKLINKDSVKLIGPEYCIFDNKLKKREDKSFNIMINFGNSFDFGDTTEQIIKIYKIVYKKIKKLKFYITVGNGSTNYSNLIDYSNKNKNFKIIYKKFGISSYLSKMDLFVGSASTSIYEMSFLKTPSIFVICNKTQDYKISEMEKLGHYFLINLAEFKNKNFLKFLNGYLNNFNSIKDLFLNREINIDNIGAQRVCKEIKKI